jgi:hypothetical protein
MGVTLHYEGQVRDPRACEQLLATAEAFAQRQGWRMEPIRRAHTTLTRVIRGESQVYAGPTAGVTLFAHERAEPVRLELGRDLFVQGWTKTQLAPPEVHVQIVSLLRLLQPFFRDLTVRDEGEYWETADLALLCAHLRETTEILAAIQAPSPRPPRRTNPLVQRAYGLLERQQWPQLLEEVARLDAAGELDSCRPVVRAAALGMKADALEHMGDLPGALALVLASLDLHDSSSLHFADFVLRHDLREHYGHAEAVLAGALEVAAAADIDQLTPDQKAMMAPVLETIAELRRRAGPQTS